MSTPSTIVSESQVTTTTSEPAITIVNVISENETTVIDTQRGPQGPKGDVGPANSLEIGTVVTGAPGSPADAEITGVPPTQVLSLVIPRGDVGATGPANSLTIGTVTTGAPGTAADASITGVPPNQVLSLVIPRGDVGPKGDKGDKGDTGSAGVPPGVDTQLIFNDAGAFGAASALAYNKATGSLSSTGPATFAGSPTTFVSALGNQQLIQNSAAVLDQKNTLVGMSNGGLFQIRSSTDAAPATAISALLAGARVGTAWSSLNLGNVTDNPAYNFLGTGTATFGNTASGRFAQITQGVAGLRYDDNSLASVMRLYNAGMGGAPIGFGLTIDVQLGVDNINLFPGGRIAWLATADWGSVANRDTAIGLYYGRDGAYTLAIMASDIAIQFGNATTSPAYNFLGTGLATFGGSIITNGVLSARNYSGLGAGVKQALVQYHPTNNCTYIESGDGTTPTPISLRGSYTLIESGSLRMLDGKVTITDANDGFMRLNNTNQYGNGIYTPGRFRADGGVETGQTGIGYYGGGRSLLWNTGQMAYGTCYVTGTVGGYVGVALNDSGLGACFMSNGSTAGIYLQSDSTGKWLLYRVAAGNAAKSDYPMEAPSFNAVSSRKLKRETGKPFAAWTMLRQLRPILYRLRSGEGREQLGLVAEEVAEVCPWLSDGKTVAYDRLAMLLLADWQERQGLA